MKTATLKTYSIGLVASVGLTLGAYALVVNKMLTGQALVLTILAMAVVQLVVQMIYFLGAESANRWNFGTFMLTLGTVIIVLGGSIWIMNHLNYAMMSDAPAMEKYIKGQQGF
jgi:cytochrome o ubiquinol oxidase operon protein cyoD